MNTTGGLGGTPDCGDVVQSMYEYLDGEIDDARREHVRSHLQECIPCLEAFEFEAELKSVIAQRCKDELPQHLYSRVQMTLRAEIEGNPSGGGIPAD